MVLGIENSRNIGFTLIELLVTLSIATIVLATAVPSFKQAIHNNRIATQTNNLVTALNVTRSEAVKRGVQVDMVGAAAGWHKGWKVGIDSNNDDDFADAGDLLIQSWNGMPTNFTLTSGLNVMAIHYGPDGSSVADTFTLSPPTADCPSGEYLRRQISITRVGQLTVSNIPCP